MPVEIIDILKPKNNGDFPVADAEDIAYDETTTIKTKIDAKQDKLVSGTNIKSVNGQSLLGAGNIEIESGSSFEIPTVNGVITSESDDGLTMSGTIDDNGVSAIRNNTIVKFSILGQVINLLVNGSGENFIGNYLMDGGQGLLGVTLFAFDLEAKTFKLEMKPVAVASESGSSGDTPANIKIPDIEIKGDSSSDGAGGIVISGTFTTEEFTQIENNDIIRFYMGTSISIVGIKVEPASQEGFINFKNAQGNNLLNISEVAKTYTLKIGKIVLTPQDLEIKPNEEILCLINDPIDRFKIGNGVTKTALRNFIGDKYTISVVDGTLTIKENY